MARTLLSRTDRLVDAGVLFSALFTLVAHATVYLGGSLRQLGFAFVCACALVVVLALARARLGLRAAPDAAWTTDSEGAGRASAPAPPPWQRATVVLLAATAGVGHWLEVDVTLVWLAAAAASASAAGFTLAAAPPDEPTSAARGPESSPGSGWQAVVALALVSAFCVVVTALSNRPDADDAFYLNIAVAAVDRPDAPLLSSDTLHGVPGVPLALPVYKVHALELLEAGLARTTRSNVLDIAHLALPLLVALVLPFAHARLLRRLVSDQWLLATCIAVAFLALSGGGSHGWQNFGLVRLHQGKAILLTVFCPLVAAYAIEYARRPSRRRWIVLAGAQIAAVGLSASALWLAPLLAALGLLSETGGAWRSARPGAAREAAMRFARGLAASGYVVAVAVALRAATEAAFANAVVPSPEASASSVQLAHQAARASLGGGAMAAFMAFAAFGSWSFCGTPLARRFCVVFALGSVVLWNPLLASYVAGHVTSPPTYWRAFWLVPMPALVAIALASGTRVLPIARPAVRAMLVLALAVALFQLSPRQRTLSAANHVAFAPGWRVPPTAFAAASALAEYAGAGEAVLAARGVAPWVVAVHDHPYPLVVRPAYLPALARHVEQSELRERVALLRLVSGEERPPHAAEGLRRAIGRYRLRAVCATREVAQWQDLVDVLHEEGFQQVHESADYVVWAAGS